MFAIPAVLALVGYILVYGCDAHLRTHRGPWEVLFSETDGTPWLRIREPALGISNVLVRFIGEQVPAGTSARLPGSVRFNEPMKSVPFGRVAFDDLMYQPGTVVLHCFGHEVQMLPRALYLDRREHPWVAEGVFDLTPGMKVPNLTPPSRSPSDPAAPATSAAPPR